MSRPAEIDPTQLPSEARRLVEQATTLEVGLLSLADLLDGSRPAATPALPELAQAPAALAGGGALAEAASTAVVSCLPRVRQLCDAAREHRHTAEHFVGKVLSEPRIAGRLSSSRLVLVVDDADDTRELAAIALDAAGVNTITAANGLDALIAAHTQRPGVILMDVNMPVLNGIEATRLLKAAATTRHIHVIAHTARMDFEQEQASSLFAHVLLKPSLPSDVVASVKAFLAEQPTRGPGN